MAISTKMQILSVLDEQGGFTTGDIAKRIESGRGRRESALVRQMLLSMKREGLVVEMDDQKPVCWMRTQKGTKALKMETGLD